jgi:hypothetical protein
LWNSMNNLLGHSLKPSIITWTIQHWIAGE